MARGVYHSSLQYRQWTRIRCGMPPPMPSRVRCPPPHRVLPSAPPQAFRPPWVLLLSWLVASVVLAMGWAVELVLASAGGSGSCCSSEHPPGRTPAPPCLWQPWCRCQDRSSARDTRWAQDTRGLRGGTHRHDSSAHTDMRGTGEGIARGHTNTFLAIARGHTNTFLAKGDTRTPS